MPTTAKDINLPGVSEPVEQPPAEPASVDLEDVALDAEDAAPVFPQGVASGGPKPKGVICWTRIAPDAYRPSAELAIEVAPTVGSGYPPKPISADEVDYCGHLTDAPDPDHDYTVRTRLDGHLDPATAYRYRFVYDGIASPTGRCRTLPASDASPESVQLAVLACQDYQNGYFGALGHVAHDPVDFVLHLGDFIYNASDGRYTGLDQPRFADRDIELPSGNDVAHTLCDFWTLYRTYRSDPLLADAAAAHTFIRTWDDHAIANNRFWDYKRGVPAAPDHPRGDDPEFVRELTSRGIRSFYEYTPARVKYDPAKQLQEAFKLYESLQFGDLLTLFVTDERLYRSRPPCRGSDETSFGPVCDERMDPERTMLKSNQREWLCDGFRSSETRWTAWANEVLSLPLSTFRIDPTDRVYRYRALTDSWDGYPAERERVFSAMDANDATAFVTLTGDLHSVVVGDQRLDGERVGIECMTPAVTSINGTEKIRSVVSSKVGIDVRDILGERTLNCATRAVYKLIEGLHPDVRLFRSDRWGYATATFTHEDFTFDVYDVDKTVDAADASRSKLESVTVPHDCLL